MSRRVLVRQIVRRLVFAGALVFVASSAALLLTHLAPGDAATELVRPGVSAETVKDRGRKLGQSQRPSVVASKNVNSVPSARR